ncbi:MAG TPA: acyl-ACP--UDP-N-acetylglucosamine O-acyltransferase [Bacteroidales bacterium]|nr:acyl-ACP--UDP-N-acetylglucosamine O-acyltransferase [Bacteroidales bacterium]
MSDQISRKAEIHPDAIIGKNVTIESFARIGKGVTVGDGSWIGSNAIIYEGATLGKNCKVFPGAVISAMPQDLKFKGEQSFVEIGDNSVIRESVTVNRGTASKGVTKIGNNCLLMAYVHIAHDCILGNYCILSNGVQIAGEVEIDDWAIIGGMSTIHQFCRIGKHAMISGMSGVLSDVPPFLKAAGIPVVYQGINYVGLKRRGFSKEMIDEIHSIYRILYQEKYNTSQAVEYIEKNFNQSQIQEEILSFIKSSERGIIKKLSDLSVNKYNNHSAEQDDM